MKNPFHVMIIPTLGCPGRCKYCWSSEEGSPVMTIDTVKDIVAWLNEFHKERVTFTFHGGEPPLAGADFYRQTSCPHAVHVARTSQVASSSVTSPT